MMRLMLFVLAGVLGCGGGGTTENHPPSNQPPVIDPAASQTSLVMGQSTSLDAHATDADNDPLTYSWTQTSPASPQGTFGSPTSASTSWTAPMVAANTPFILTVTVSDGHGHSPAVPVKVFSKTSTDPSFMADVQPLLIQCFGGCHTSNAGTQPLAEYPALVTLAYPRPLPFCDGQLLAVAGDPDNSVLFKTMTGTGCGPQMPPGGPFLGTDKIDLVRTWISQGAVNN